jgi:hypothetical protein
VQVSKLLYKSSATVHTRWFRPAALALALAATASAQIAILQIRVVDGEGAVHAPGSRNPHPLAVEVTDESGKPVEGAAVSFHLPEDGPTGTFFNGLRTVVATTDAAGRAALSGLILNRVSGRFEIRVIASREQARAGIVSFQYIAEAASGAAHPAAAARAGSRTKWLIIAAAAGVAAAAGILGAGRSANTTAVTSSAPSSPISVGPPTVTVTRP